MKNRRLIELLKDKGMTVSVAESCTGGILSAALVDIPGASAVFPGGIISYSDEVKSHVLGVDPQAIQKYTAVSSEVASQMARCVAEKFSTDAAISVTGYAGPSGGDDGTPAGRVYIGLFLRGVVSVEKNDFQGGRDDVRHQAAERGIELLTELIEKQSVDTCEEM